MTAAVPELPEPILRVEDLVVDYRTRTGFGGATAGTLRAVDGVSFDLQRGTTLGLVGESGCGKSTLGRAVLKLVAPTGGSVLVDGVDVAGLRGRDLRSARSRMQMVFQDPYASLDPRQSVGKALAEPLRAHGIARGAELDRRVGDLLDKVGLPRNAAERYPHEFSGGQRQRIGLARALSLEPALIVADEPVSALDVSVQAQIVNLLLELQVDLGLSYLFISHDLSVVRHMSDRIAVMYLGRIVELADADELTTRPRHPYTRALLSAVPSADPERERVRERIVLSGDAPRATDRQRGCAFVQRCPVARPERCADERPRLRVMGSGHTVACHYAEELA
jgi:peptide/nickel transport system ATP-binding protein